MKPSSLAAAEKENVALVQDVATLLTPLEDVRAVKVHEDRRPIRLLIQLSTSYIPPAVRDIIDERDLVIEDAQCTVDAGLTITTYLLHEFEFFEEFQVRKHGNSLVVTLPRPALARAGADEGSPARIYARPGELRIKTDP